MALAALAIAFLPADVLGALGGDSPEAPDRVRLGGIMLLTLMADGILLADFGGISVWLYLCHTQTPLQEGR
jgi:hypothetical protein